MTPEQLIQYYIGLLIMQYQKPKFQGAISAFVTQSVASLIVMQVRGGFNLATAVGAQLDCLGEIIGVTRNIVGYNAGTSNFSMPDYSDAAAGTYIGMTPYIQTPSGHWRRYSDTSGTYIMPDGVFAQFIQFLVAVRASDYSLGSLDEIFFEFFGTYVTITDNLDMTMTYTHSNSDPGILFGILNYLNLLPHPAGVSYSVVAGP